MMARNLPTVRDCEPLESGLRLLNASRSPAVLVLGGDGRLVGLLTPENMGEMMMVCSVRPDWRFRARQTERSRLSGTRT